MTFSILTKWGYRSTLDAADAGAAWAEATARLDDGDEILLMTGQNEGGSPTYFTRWEDVFPPEGPRMMTFSIRTEWNHEYMLEAPDGATAWAEATTHLDDGDEIVVIVGWDADGHLIYRSQWAGTDYT